MKKLLFFVLVLLLYSCHQEENKPTAPNNVIPNAIKDIDGNSYDAVVIGQQTWMLQNLRTKKYADGTPITYMYDPSDPSDYPICTSPGETSYMSSENSYPPNANISTGLLYNWLAAVNCSNSSNTVPSHVQGACPNGWHIPSKAEWQQLVDYVESMTVCDCGLRHIAKSLSSVDTWRHSGVGCSPGNSTSSNNNSGFNAIAAGRMLSRDEAAGIYNYDFSYSANYWSCTKEKVNSTYVDSTPCSFKLEYNYPSVALDNSSFTYLSVRCIKD